MQISLLLMEEIAKLFAIMLMGYAVVKAGLMKSSESKSISVVMVYLVIPCVIIDAFQVDYTADVKKGLLLACVAAVLVHVLFLILTTILKQVLQLDTIERATVIYSNAGILVIPLVQDLLGQEYVIYSSAYIAVQLILIWTHCKNMLCEEDRLEWKKVFLNVNIISERKYYFNHSRSDIVYQQNPVAFRRAGYHGYDEQYDWSDRYAACRNGYCGCTS